MKKQFTGSFRHAVHLAVAGWSFYKGEGSKSAKRVNRSNGFSRGFLFRHVDFYSKNPVDPPEDHVPEKHSQSFDRDRSSRRSNLVTIVTRGRCLLIMLTSFGFGKSVFRTMKTKVIFCKEHSDISRNQKIHQKFCGQIV